MYYEPKNETFVIENKHKYSTTLIGLCVLNPGERKKFRRGKIKLYEEDRGFSQPFIHMGFWHIAVEVDGYRYEYFKEKDDIIPVITKIGSKKMTREEYIKELDELYVLAKNKGDIALTFSILERLREETGDPCGVDDFRKQADE